MLTVFIKIYIELCGKSPKFCRHPHFPAPSPPQRPQTSAFYKLPIPPLPLCGHPLWTAPKYINSN